MVPTASPTPSPENKRRGRVGVVIKTDTLHAAEFIEGAALPPSAPPSAPLPANVIPFVNPILTDDDLARLAAADALELEDAKKKLAAGAKITPRERKLLNTAKDNQSRPQHDPPSAAFDPDKLAASINAWWVNGDGSNYQLKDTSSYWLRVPESKLLLALQRRGVPGYPVSGEPLSRLDQTVLHIMEHRTLDRSIEAIAGYQDGVHSIKGSRVLVRRGPKLVTPKAGEWNTIHALLRGLLLLEDPACENPYIQIDRFHYWMSRAVENLYNSPGVRLNSQILILAGPRGFGKSRLQHMVITPLLGGRSADPSRYLFGETTFNSGWMGCEHLLIEDPRPSMKMLDRLQLAQHLKALCVNEDQSLHAKGADEFGVDAEFTVSVSINDDPDSLRILPPLTPDIIDKIQLFQVGKNPLPMPTRTGAERKAFQQAIAEEIPAYCHYLLNECVVPDELKSDRFGVLHYQEPNLKLILWEDSPASELLALLDTAQVLTDTAGSLDNRRPFFTTAASYDGDAHLLAYPLTRKDTAAGRLQARALAENKRIWVGSYQELQSQLETCQHRGIAKKLIDHNAVTRLLSRLAEDHPDRVAPHRTSTARLWFILAPEPTLAEPDPVID